MKLAPGETIVGFSRPRTWNPLSELIMGLTASKVSHVWLCYYDDDLEMDMIMEAHTTFRLIPMECWIKEGNIIVAIARPGVNLDPGLRKVALWLGTPYNVGGIMGMVPVLLKRLWRGIKAHVHNPLHTTKALFCSEAVAIALREVGQFSSSQPCDTVTPQDLYDLFVEQGKLEVQPC